jgi:hypothetical protein
MAMEGKSLKQVTTPPKKTYMTMAFCYRFTDGWMMDSEKHDCRKKEGGRVGTGFKNAAA